MSTKRKSHRSSVKTRKPARRAAAKKVVSPEEPMPPAPAEELVDESATRLFGFGSKAFTAEEKERLRSHVINMSRGEFKSSGDFESSEEDVRTLFGRHLPEALAKAAKDGRPLRVLFWAHGGLVPERDALEHVLAHSQGWQDAGIYPVYFIWETDFLSTLKSIFGLQRRALGQRGIGDFFGTIKDALTEAKDFVVEKKDDALEATLHTAGVPVWGEMKRFAAAASAPRGAAHFTAQRLAEFVRANAAKSIELYACGHSAGSIFHSFFLPAAGSLGVKFRELYLLAPAITTRDFADRLAHEIGSGKTVERTVMFTMNDAAEQADHVANIYNKSLLYFVSGACEPERGTDVLGMEVSLRRTPAMRALFGLDGASPRGLVVFSPNNSETGPSASNSTTHGGFDNDHTTLNSMARRITGNNSINVFLPEETRGAGEARAGVVTPAMRRTVEEKLNVRLALRFGGIESVRASRGEREITALVVGHYQGVEPTGAELALDRALTEACAGKEECPDEAGKPDERNLVITTMTRRGVLPGALGTSQVIPFPASDKRFVMLAGLGEGGTLGPAELSSVVQELCLSASRIGVRHLASVLIGSGEGNLKPEEALAAWAQGILRAFRTASEACHLNQITLVEFEPGRFRELASSFGRVFKQQGIATISDVWKQSVNDRKRALDEELKQRRSKLVEFEKIEREIVEGREPPSTDPPAAGERETRINIRSNSKGYIFAAMTSDASVPQRDIPVDPKLVDSVSVELATNPDAALQRKWGRTLERLLIPADHRDTLFNSASHLVLTVDASSARIPWEMMLLPGRGNEEIDLREAAEQFIGTAQNYGITRQLQTGFAPAPQPSLRPKGQLRALVIADPAPDASLSGACREGDAVAACLSQHGVDVVYLSRERATRAAVARELFNEPFDILHFAGHCHYDRENHVLSGWIFRAEPLECFTAQEMARLDRVPPFVFSNACESGITPERERKPNLPAAPAFAEAFFARGVRNFICTGWEVNDTAAVRFAETFYNQTLNPEIRATFREAVRTARAAAMKIDVLTWGAYQHYGNPSWRFPDPRGPEERWPVARAETGGGKSGPKTQKKGDKPAGRAGGKPPKPPGRPYATPKPNRGEHPEFIEVKVDPAAAAALDRMAGESGSRLRSIARGGGDLRASGAGLIADLVEGGDITDITPLTAGAPPATRTGIRRALTAGHENASPDDPLAGVSIVKVRPGTGTRVLGQLAANPAFSEVWPVPLRYLTAAKKTAAKPPSNAWNLPKIQWAAARALAGFKEPKAIKVAVLDTGVHPDHPDLKGRVAVYHHDPANTGVGTEDIVGHGSHVCGTIAANFRNTRGVRGLCDCKLMVWKIFADDPWQDDDEGTRSYFVDPAMYLRSLAECIRQKVHVINLSIGGEGGPSPAERTLFRQLEKNGIIVVAAMGNERQEGNPTSYPAAIPGVIAIGATDRKDGSASFSNTGAHIAVSAPGVAIWSTLPTYPGEFSQYLENEEWKPDPREKNYASWDGTSMASPHVAAAVAMLLSVRGTMSPAGVKKALQDSADKVAGMNGRKFTEKFGAGRLNLLRLLQ